jgi:hypothetical protein
VSDSIQEVILAAFVTALNTNTPSGVPLTERARWVDIDAVREPIMSLAGYLDDPDPNQKQDAPIDVRQMKVAFDLYGKKSSTVAVGKSTDLMRQWLIAALCGTWETGTLAGKVYRVRLGKTVGYVEKGDVFRAGVEIVVDYRTLVNDSTSTG